MSCAPRPNAGFKPSPEGLIQGIVATPTNEFVPFEKNEIDKSISDRFEQQVRRYPHHIAVKLRNRTFTYLELNEIANRIGRVILGQSEGGVKPIGLLLEKDAPMIAAMLGVLKAGRAYVPLDPAHPHQRLQRLLDDAWIELIITDNRSLHLAERLANSAIRLLNIDEDHSSISTENIGLAVSCDTPCYIIYTSGSTGEPKGVVQNHRSVLHKVWWHTNSLRLCAHDRLTLLASCAAGQSATDIYSALLNGAAVYPFDVRKEGLAALTTLLIKEEITVYHSGASVFSSFVDSLSGNEEFPKLRFIKLGGEAVSKKEVEMYTKHFSTGCLLVYSLSATETGTVSQYTIDKNTTITGNIVPVGYSVDDKQILLLNETGQEVGFNEVGEITVRSRYFASGYWRKPEQTQAAFVIDSPGSDLRIFRTGDIGRSLPDGALVHLGRKDSRVKIRGNRVELAEVEAALLEVTGVKRAVVVAQEDENGERVLVAYIVSTAEGAKTPALLRRALLEQLPGYMVPSLFVFLDVLPLTPQGKIDRRTLQSRRARLDLLAPRDDTEVQLAEIWRNLLGVDRVGVRDDFFELGGDSLLALRLLSQIEQTFGKEIPPSVFVKGATVESLANALIGQCKLEPSSMLVGATQATSCRPFFYLHGDFSGAGLYSIRLARLLGEEFPFYALQRLQRFERPLLPTIESMATAHLNTLQSVQSHGPYRLGGYCYGGLVAFELAQQLRRRGEAVEQLFIIDAVAHNTDARLLAKLVRFAGMVSSLNDEETLDLFLFVKLFKTRWDERSGLERLLFFLSKAMIAAKRARWLKRIFAPNAGPGGNTDSRNCAPAIPVPADDLERMTAEYTAHLHKLISGYVPQSYPSPLTLLVSEERRRTHSQPTLGWQNVSPEVDLHFVPGDHHTCLTKHLDVIADCLRSRLERTNFKQESRAL